jgi:hypothetical protein
MVDATLPLGFCLVVGRELHQQRAVQEGPDTKEGVVDQCVGARDFSGWVRLLLFPLFPHYSRGSLTLILSQAKRLPPLHMDMPAGTSGGGFDSAGGSVRPLVPSSLPFVKLTEVLCTLLLLLARSDALQPLSTAILGPLVQAFLAKRAIRVRSSFSSLFDPCLPFCLQLLHARWAKWTATIGFSIVITCEAVAAIVRRLFRLPFLRHGLTIFRNSSTSPSASFSTPVLLAV